MNVYHQSLFGVVSPLQPSTPSLPFWPLEIPTGLGSLARKKLFSRRVGTARDALTVSVAPNACRLARCSLLQMHHSLTTLYTDFHGTEWERKDLKPPIIECDSRNDDMTRLIGYASETFNLMNGWTGWDTWTDELGDGGASPIKSFLTFYKTLRHINAVRSNLSTHSNTFYVEADRVRPRIVCVNEHERPFEKYSSLQPDWRSECQSVRGVIPILFSAAPIFESPAVLVCPRFWDWPDRPLQRNQESCPTLNPRKTAYNTDPEDLQLLLFKSYFLMLAVIVRGLPGHPPGLLSRINLNSRMRSPNICASLGADESLQTALAEMFYVAC